MNSSGIRPSEFKCVIELKPVEEKSKGGIIIPEMTKDKEKYASTEGRIVAVAPGAFSYLSEEEWEGQKPRVGDLVVFAKYGGLHKAGRDGKDYVILNDKDICAVVEE